MRRMPRASTRGFYDLGSGAVRERRAYDAYPKYFFRDPGPEVAVMVHGMRNDAPGALKKFEIASAMLARCGYRHRTVGFTYDADVPEGPAQLRVARKIAARNGANLAKLALDMRAEGARVRILGHSLGSVVALSAVLKLDASGRGRGALESVHLFGGSAEAADARACCPALRRVCRSGATNVYAPSDPVLAQARSAGELARPVGLAACSPCRAWTDRRARPAGHRFAQYARAVSRFP